MEMEWEIFWHSLEEKSKYTMTQLGLALGSWLKSVNDVHLKVHELTVDGVFGWSMEMILQSMEVAAIDMWLEQTNGRCSEEIFQW